MSGLYQALIYLLAAVALQSDLELAPEPDH
jgi:hypothetical protein